MVSACSPARTPVLRRAGTVVALLVASACTDATLGLVAPDPIAARDDRLSLDGTFCTDPAADTEFPVKILFLIDLSNSMCYSDPASGACTAARCDQGPNSPASNPTPPRRAQAVNEILNRFQGNPAVQFAVVTFSSRVDAEPWDSSGGQVAFTNDRSRLGLDRLRNVDSVTDYQGALARVKTILSDDMAAVAARRRTELPRTKYAVMFLTDGAPFPRCSIADPARNQPPDAPNCASQPSTCTICQVGGREDFFSGLVKGEDYNEPYQLSQIADEMHRLADTWGVGDLKVHTALLRVDNAAVCCPDCFTDDPTGTVAESLLAAIAMPEKGLGTFTRFRTTGDLSFVDYNLTSLRQTFAARSLIAFNENLVPHPSGAAVDTDGDGLDDEREFKLGLDRTKTDSDGDGYSDFFESLRPGLFDPLTSQADRCRAFSTKCPGQGPCDTDGDGLRDCEEAELGTDPELVDTDADGLPDGLEHRRGLDPLRDDRHEDLDFDGVSNLDEVLRFSAPTERDARSVDSVQASFEETHSEADGRSCYAFGARNLRLPQTLTRAPEGPPLGWSDTLVWLSEAPRGDLRDYGRFRVACIRARFVPPGIRLPVESTVVLRDADFHDPAELDRDRDCRGARP